MSFLSKFFPKKIERLSFPEKHCIISFQVEGRDFNYKGCRGGGFALTGGASGLDELYVSLGTVDKIGWILTLQVNGGTKDVANCTYTVKHLEDLPLELFNFISRLSRSCWEELEEQPKRWQREREAEKARALNQLIGASGMLSPNPLIRSLAQKTK